MSLWLGFDSHHAKGINLDIPRIRDNPELFINSFCELVDFYVEKYDIPTTCFFNLDGCGVKPGENSKSAAILTFVKYLNIPSNESGENTNIVELIRSTGVAGLPLFIFKGKHVMQKCIPSPPHRPFCAAATKTAFINKNIFISWIVHNLWFFAQAGDGWC